MHKNTKNLLDLLQDSLNVDNKKNILPTLISKTRLLYKVKSFIEYRG
jgi:hypothetical protein